MPRTRFVGFTATNQPTNIYTITKLFCVSLPQGLFEHICCGRSNYTYLLLICHLDFIAKRTTYCNTTSYNFLLLGLFMGHLRPCGTVGWSWLDPVAVAHSSPQQINPTIGWLLETPKFACWWMLCKKIVYHQTLYQFSMFGTFSHKVTLIFFCDGWQPHSLVAIFETRRHVSTLLTGRFFVATIAAMVNHQAMENALGVRSCLKPKSGAPNNRSQLIGCGCGWSIFPLFGNWFLPFDGQDMESHTIHGWFLYILIKKS